MTTRCSWLVSEGVQCLREQGHSGNHIFDRDAELAAITKMLNESIEYGLWRQEMLDYIQGSLLDRTQQRALDEWCKEKGWREGLFDIGRMSKETSDPVWGTMRVETTLAELGHLEA